jgi:hypothetical protein
VADRLSRRVHEIHATTISMYKIYLCNIILEFSKSYMHYVNISVTLE